MLVNRFYQNFLSNILDFLVEIFLDCIGQILGFFLLPWLLFYTIRFVDATDLLGSDILRA